MALELSIIIPTCTQLALLEECVKSIRTNTISYEIIIVANSEDKNFHDAVDKLKNGNTKIIHLDEMVGFIKACNVGAKESIGSNICILNDDTVVGLNWARNLLRELKRDVHQTGPSLRFLDKNFDAVNKCTPRPFLEGWCFIITRHIYYVLGTLFDENLQFSYCEDSDLSTSIINAGFTISKVDINIQHHGTVTRRACDELNKKCFKYEEINKKYLQKKWRKLL